MTTGNNRSSLVPVQPHIEQKDTKLGLIGLIAIVIGEVIGGGIFNIPKILGEGASLEAILIGWMISTTGILSIALTFKTFRWYLHTRTGFGNYAGFNNAWGYWVGTALGNIVFSIMLNDAFGLFFPVLLEHGWPTLIFTPVSRGHSFSSCRSGFASPRSLTRFLLLSNSSP